MGMSTGTRTQCYKTPASMNKSLNEWYTCYGKHKLEEWKYNDAVYPSGLDRDE